MSYFPDGFRDATYVETEREYKWAAHQRFRASLGDGQLRELIDAGQHAEAALRAVSIESRTNLLFSFEKMALRDAVRSDAGARAFARGLLGLLQGAGDLEHRFERWCDTVAGLPRRKTRVLTWPLVTVFGFIADPKHHLFLKPNVTRRAARSYGFDLDYHSRPNYQTYSQLLAFAQQIRSEQAYLKPRDMIDIQSFIWVLGSDEYPD